jgi:hypothetical protein
MSPSAFSPEPRINAYVRAFLQRGGIKCSDFGGVVTFLFYAPRLG